MRYTIYLLLAFGAIIAITSTPNTPPQPLPTAAAETPSAAPETPLVQEEAPALKPPQSAAKSSTPAPAKTVSTPAAPAPAGAPTFVRIPSVGINNPIVRVGTNSAGEMDVPSGQTRNIGWYGKGVIPGETGSAVFAAHVFAAFGNLHKTNVGDEIFVQTESGGWHRFVVEDKKTMKLEDVSADALFNRKGGRYLHLITCAGAPTSDGSTYTHRTIVYARLAS